MRAPPLAAPILPRTQKGVRAGIADIAPYLIGHDPRHLDRINDIMDGSLKGHNHAKAAIDIACWDIFGKSVNMPVSALSCSNYA